MAANFSSLTLSDISYIQSKDASILRDTSHA